MSRKYIGGFNGIPVYEDPNCPLGKMYFMNDNYTDFAVVDARSRWQRFKDWLRRLVRR